MGCPAIDEDRSRADGTWGNVLQGTFNSKSQVVI
jgi:hypothetical protein